MIRHTVLLTFAEGTDDATITGIVDSLSRLPDLVPTIRDYRIGRDLSLAADNAELVVQGDFDDVEGYVAYRDHPEHRAVIDAQIRPVLVARSAAQHEF